MRIRFKIFLVTFLISKVFTQGVIINEIMNAPLGGEPEWIEIYNFSDVPFNLKNWKISNRLTSTKYVITTTDFFLQPYSFAIITRSDTIYNFHAIIPAKVFIVPSLPTSRFRNDSDAVVLFDSLNLVVDSVYYKSDWVKAGYSIERIYPNRNSNLKSTWGISVDPERSTPGRKNSISAKSYDLALRSLQILPEQIFQAQSFSVTVGVLNVGIYAISSFNVELWIDSSRIEVKSVSQYLNSGDSSLIEFRHSGLSAGSFSLVVKVIFEADENQGNNSIQKQIQILQPPFQQGSIVINEIMYAPISPEPEWIELYNTTDKTVNLNSWRVGDSQTLRTISQNFSILPNDFAVISSKDTIFSIYPWLERNKVLIFSLPALNNDEDAVRIYDNYGRLIDSIYYFAFMGDGNGYSLERVSPMQPSNQTSNWGTSKSPFRATPLRKNSLTQKDYDIEISNAQINSKVFKGIPFEISVTVKNPGKLQAQNISVRMYFDKNDDGKFEDDEFVSSNSINFLNVGDSIIVRFDFVVEEIKKHFLLFKADFYMDEDTFNNVFKFSFEVSYNLGAIVITEIMFSPLNDEPEWIEIFNPSGDGINLKGWKIGDASSKFVVTTKDFILPPLSYLVITSDSSIVNFYTYFFTFIKTQVPTLNNDKDAVVIYDHTGNVIDSIFYYGRWGKVGFSLERIYLDGSALDSTNWSVPLGGGRATPGKENSAKAKGFDLKISSVKVPQNIAYGEEINAEVTVKNVGINSANNFTVRVFVDSDLDSSISGESEIFSARFQQILNRKDSASFILKFHGLSSGESQLIFFLDFAGDENVLNNFYTVTIKIGFVKGSVVVNEIMFDPLPGFCKYIEIYNRSDSAINLKGWKFNDMRSQSGSANFLTISHENLILKPNAYLILASDSSIFNYFTSPAETSGVAIAILGKSLSLNNDFDDVVITDLTGRIIDSLRYFSTWHSSIVKTTRGRSLEKINPDLPSENRNSWSTSSASVGGTPGKKNTTFVNIKAQTEESVVFVSPNPFSPDGDGFDDVCIISYVLPFDAGEVTVRVFDSYGRPIRTLAVNEYSTKHGSFKWDGTSDDGRTLRIGIYIILFEANSERGERFAKKIPVVLAKKL